MTILPLYFETLPLHPQPKRLESLSSYIMRIAEANEIYQIRALYRLMDISGRAIHFTDYTQRFLGEVALRTGCPVPNLLATTFYYAGEKFGRSARGNALSRFFNASLGNHLRYCPPLFG